MTKTPDIVLTPMESSAIQAHGYDPATGTLRVQLHNGKVYDYHGVPLEKYAAFTGADSPGKFWNSRIKPIHGHTEIDPRARK